jgi:hypothetical protein
VWRDEPLLVMGNGVSASAIANQEGNCSSFREYFFLQNMVEFFRSLYIYYIHGDKMCI